MQSYQPIRTSEMWTTGIFNIPKGIPHLRHTFFEVDSKDMNIHQIILNRYYQYNLPCYWHATSVGFHYISLYPIDKETHHKIIKELKPLNPLCPLTTLRIKPNKYVNEKLIWRIDGIQDNPIGVNIIEHAKLEEFRYWIRNQSIGLIKKHYNTTRYPFPEIKRNKEIQEIV